jgi:hypothetical protein
LGNTANTGNCIFNPPETILIATSSIYDALGTNFVVSPNDGSRTFPFNIIDSINISTNASSPTGIKFTINFVAGVSGAAANGHRFVISGMAKIANVVI